MPSLSPDALRVLRIAPANQKPPIDAQVAEAAYCDLLKAIPCPFSRCRPNWAVFTGQWPEDANTRDNGPGISTRSMTRRGRTGKCGRRERSPCVPTLGGVRPVPKPKLRRRGVGRKNQDGG